VADPDPVSGSAGDGKAAASADKNLILRIASAAVLGPLALAAAYFGGWLFALFWTAAALAVLWEWVSLVNGTVWILSGIIYAATLLAAPLVLRHDAIYGFAAIVMLFAIVWTTDVLGYFAGRAIGGPKLMPAVSPKKTWSGALAGTFGATLVAVLAAHGLGAVNLMPIASVAFGLSVVAQAGDLLESWVKRRFGAKDASHLIPGHGGVMDRLDGFWAAAVAGCLIGLLRGGFDAPARGLLVW
jgi:phosphatidate cytidylyltransferase